MRVAGIIAEYDPFHNGHAYHVARTRELTGCDYVVACMDGHFSQRGEPTPFSKWSRARMALSCGVDAVFELPALHAIRTADAFARGGVDILGLLGVDYLSFGSETDDLSVIESIAETSIDEPKSVADAIEQGLKQGKSHARAWGEAVSVHLGLPLDMLNRPNLILAVEYVKAIRAGNYRIRPVPVLRMGEYHDPSLEGFASATAIRAALARGETGAALENIPVSSRPYAVPEKLHAMDDLLMYILRSMSLESIASLPYISEGLEHRLHRLCRETGTRDDLLTALKCKRYTHARLSRLLTHALLGIDSELLSEHPAPEYARLTGIRRGAEPLLRELKARSTIPIASSISDIRDTDTFRLECRATDMWSLLHDDPALRLPGRELTEKFIRQ